MNYGAEGKQFEDKDTMVGASFISAAFALMQTSSIDLAQYYVASQPSVYNGLLYMRTGAFTPVAHAFHEFNKLFHSDGALEIISNSSEPYAIAAKSGDLTRALISNYRKEASVLKLELPGKSFKVFGLCDGGFGLLCEGKDIIELPLSSYTVYYVEAV